MLHPPAHSFLSGAAARDGRVSEILDAARRCFARSGYHGTSIKAIANEADIRSPSILHYHFPSKEAIFLAVMREALGSLAARATEIALEAPGDGPRGLGAIDAFFALLDREPDLAPLMIECMAMGVREETSRGALSAMLNALEDLVADAIARLLGERADSLPLDRRTLAATVIDLLAGHAMRTALRRSAASGVGEGGGPASGPAIAGERRGILTLLGLLRPESHAADGGAAPASAGT